MITESMVYWILKLDNIVEMFVVFAVISILSSMIILGIWFVKREDCYGNENLDNYVKISVISFALFIAFLMAATFTPSTKQMAIIKIVPIIAKCEITKEIKGDAKEVYKLGVQAIKESLVTKNKEE